MYQLLRHPGIHPVTMSIKLMFYVPAGEPRGASSLIPLKLPFLLFALFLVAAASVYTLTALLLFIFFSFCVVCGCVNHLVAFVKFQMSPATMMRFFPQSWTECCPQTVCQTLACVFAACPRTFALRPLPLCLIATLTTQSFSLASFTCLCVGKAGNGR